VSSIAQSAARRRVGLGLGRRPTSGEQVAHDAAAPMVRRGDADHAEEPRLERRAPVEAGAAVEDLHVRRLQDILREAPFVRAAGQRPSEGVAMAPGEFAS
jgi:hypothetical protein